MQLDERKLGEVKKKKHSQDYKETHNFFNSVPLECLPASRGTRCFKKETKSTEARDAGERNRNKPGKAPFYKKGVPRAPKNF